MSKMGIFVEQVLFNLVAELSHRNGGQNLEKLIERGRSLSSDPELEDMKITFQGEYAMKTRYPRSKIVEVPFIILQSERRVADMALGEFCGLGIEMSFGKGRSFAISSGRISSTEIEFTKQYNGSGMSEEEIAFYTHVRESLLPHQKGKPLFVEDKIHYGGSFDSRLNLYKGQWKYDSTYVVRGIESTRGDFTLKSFGEKNLKI